MNTKNNIIDLDFSSLESIPEINHRLILTITYPDKVVEKEIYVNKNKKITFGSSEYADIIITDSSIAPIHFSFSYDEKPVSIEIYENNTLFKEKENSFYSGLIKIKIEKYKDEDYSPISNDLFKIITQGVSIKKTLLFFISLLVIYYLSTISDVTFLVNEESGRDVSYYFTLWILPNLIIGILSIMYIIFTYFTSSKHQRFFTKIIQQNILKYSIKLSIVYFMLNISLYIINGLININGIYTIIMQGVLIFNFYLISKKIINLNQYEAEEKKKITRVGNMYFIMLFLFVEFSFFNIPYITWLPIQSRHSIENNMDLENQAAILVNSLKKTK